jgi:hypothetical protein
MTSRPSTAAPILAAVAIVLLPLGGYVAGYFWLGERTQWYIEDLAPSGGPGPPQMVVLESGIERCYSQPWLMLVYQPMGRLETWLLGTDVEISWSGPDE